LDELFRVLRPHGLLLISVPNITSLTYRVAWAIGHIPSCAASGDLGPDFNGTGYRTSEHGRWIAGHVADYNPPRLRAVLNKQGFDVERLRGSGLHHRRQIAPAWLVPAHLSSALIAIARLRRRHVPHRNPPRQCVPGGHWSSVEHMYSQKPWFSTQNGCSMPFGFGQLVVLVQLGQQTKVPDMQLLFGQVPAPHELTTLRNLQLLLQYVRSSGRGPAGSQSSPASTAPLPHNVVHVPDWQTMPAPHAVPLRGVLVHEPKMLQVA
jgi:hypothetical protein